MLYTIECALEVGDIREYASTLMCALIEKKTGSTLLFNLGDGSAMRLRCADMSTELLPNTVNGIPAQTTAGNAYLAAEVKNTRLRPNETVILFSDGMAEAFSRNGAFRNYLCAGDLRAADRELDAMQSGDDKSYIMYAFR